MSETITVHQAISRVTADLPAIEKNDRGEGVSYRFRGIETLVGHLAGLLARHGVVIVPTSNLISINEVVSSKSGNPQPGWWDVVLAVDWTIYGPSGDSITARTYGIGRDNSDKGANKAQTQAFKYLLMELFCVGDKEDDVDGVPVQPEPAKPSASGGARPAPARPAVERPSAAPSPQGAAEGEDPIAAAKARGAARAAAAVAGEPDPYPPTDPAAARDAVTLPTAVLARMDALIAATPTLTSNQRQVRVGRLVRDMGGVPDSLTAMVADDQCWLAVCDAFTIEGVA